MINALFPMHGRAVLPCILDGYYDQSVPGLTMDTDCFRTNGCHSETRVAVTLGVKDREHGVINKRASFEPLVNRLIPAPKQHCAPRDLVHRQHRPRSGRSVRASDTATHRSFLGERVLCKPASLQA
jgi:hypothetical protein